MRVFKNWQAAEPVRLYAYGVLAALVAAAVVLGWVTDTQAAALGSVLTALLAVPGVEAARANVYAPATLIRERLDPERRRRPGPDQRHTPTPPPPVK